MDIKPKNTKTKKKFLIFALLFSVFCGL